MKINEGAKIVSAAGEGVGEVERVVVDPRSKEVTHLVASKGLLFKEEKVVPLDLVARSTGDEVTLRPDAGELEQLPPYEVEYFVPIGDTAAEGVEMPTSGPPVFYAYPPYLGASAAPVPVDARSPQVVVRRRIPMGSVAVEEGAEVRGYAGDRVGELTSFLTDPDDDRLSHIVVEQGTLVKHKKLVPAEWIEAMDEDRVRLAVTAATVDTLRDYGG